MENNSPVATADIVAPRRGQVHKKIRAICDACANMTKDGRNDHANYAFTSYDATMMTLRPHLSAHGLRLKFSEVSSSVDTTLKTSTNKPATGGTVKMRLYVIDIETGEFDVTEVSNFATDTGDKAVSKAITGAKKYLLFDTFEISTSGGSNAKPTHDDGDGDRNALDDTPQTTSATPARQATSQQSRRVVNQDGPAPSALVIAVRRIIERLSQDGVDITETKVLTKHAPGKERLEDTNFAQANAMNNALTKYERKHKADKARTAA